MRGVRRGRWGGVRSCRSRSPLHCSTVSYLLLTVAVAPQLILLILLQLLG